LQFFEQNWFAQLFSNYSFALFFASRILMYVKAAHKMLMKLTKEVDLTNIFAPIFGKNRMRSFFAKSSGQTAHKFCLNFAGEIAWFSNFANFFAWQTKFREIDPRMKF